MGMIVKPGHKGRRAGVNPRGVEIGSVLRATPKQIGSLAFWFRADRGITLNGSAVSAWNDLSGQGNHLAQNTGSQQPIWAATDADINNKPTVTFDGVNDVLRRTGINISGANGRTLFIVFKYIAAFAASDEVCDGSNNQMRINRFGATSLQFFTDGVGAKSIGAATFTPQTWSYYTFSANGVSSFIKDKATTRVTGDAGNAANLTAINLATFGDGASEPGNVAIAEVVGYTTILSSTDEARIRAYLAARYTL